MALTIANPIKQWQASGANAYERIGVLAFDSSYPTGGEALDFGDDCETILWFQAQPTSGYSFQFDYANQKLLVYYVDNNAAADSAQIQVPDTTDLSTLTGVRYRAMFS